MSVNYVYRIKKRRTFASTLGDVVTTPTHLSVGHNVSIKKTDHVPLGDLPVFLVRLAKQEQRDYCRLAGEVRQPPDDKLLSLHSVPGSDKNCP